MEQEIEIDVMIADASHEVYVDTILDTIESAAKVMGKQAVRDYLRLDRASGFPGLGYSETHQRHDLPACPHALAEGEDIQPYLRRCRDEDEYRVGICTGYVLRLDRR